MSVSEFHMTTNIAETSHLRKGLNVLKAQSQAGQLVWVLLQEHDTEEGISSGTLKQRSVGEKKITLHKAFQGHTSKYLMTSC